MVTILVIANSAKLLVFVNKNVATVTLSCKRALQVIFGKPVEKNSIGIEKLRGIGIDPQVLILVLQP